MKKIYLLAGAMLMGAAVNAQAPYSKVSRSPIQKGVYAKEAKKHTAAPVTTKAEGDVVWSDDFETASNWAHVSGSGHTAGDWAIVTAMPASLVSQAGGYGFTTEMNSPTGDVNGGQFAFIDSDAAGNSATQDAYFAYQSGIDLSALGNQALTLKFHQIYRRYTEAYYVQVSNDGGSTWEIFNVNPNVPVNTNSNGTEIKEINISSTIGTGNWSNDVRIRLHYQGAWDWFWGVDDIQIYESWNNDLELGSTVALAGNESLDYHFIPSSQATFPGFSFQGLISNPGALDQNNAGLNVTVSGTTYNQTGGIINGGSTVLVSQATDTFEVTNLFDIVGAGTGTYTLNYTADLGGNTDANPGNNTASSNVYFGGSEYGRDNGTTEGGLISQVSSQTDLPLKIGNLMEIFDNVAIGYIKVYIPMLSQAGMDARVGAEIEAEILSYDAASGSFVFEGNTDIHVIEATDFGTWVKLPMAGGTPLNLFGGSTILVTANHFGGTDEMVFQMAQNVEEGTVIGYTADGNPFTLSDPAAIAIRLDDDITGLSLEENNADFNLSVYPNPAQNVANVSFELENASDVSFTLTDMSGKVVYSENASNVAAGKHTLTVPTSALSNGVYFYNFKAGNAVTTQKLVINK
ncbi:MAG: T9SS type A sorting domain-containing protein [Brumimicrobium sp.]|nr:T9SS type A sorting domain-containing protein [Brumimicrobium sp.]